jgi:hypothetical protein
MQAMQEIAYIKTQQSELAASEAGDSQNSQINY